MKNREAFHYLSSVYEGGLAIYVDGKCIYDYEGAAPQPIDGTGWAEAAFEPQNILNRASSGLPHPVRDGVGLTSIDWDEIFYGKRA